MRMPFYWSDKDHSCYGTDYKGYCWNQTLQNILRANGFKNTAVFDLATDGQIPSDTFLLNRKLLKGSKVPEWIVYGIAPRDFIDNLVSKESKTLIFDRLFSIKDLISEKSGFTLNLEEKLDFLVNKCCYLYGERDGIQSSFANSLTGVSQQIFPTKIKAAELSTDAWIRTTEDYRKRYKTFDLVKFKKQATYFNSFCKEATGKGIKVLLVNMPLTQTNLALLPPGAYKAYHETVANAAKSNNVFFLDLQNSKQFPDSFFGDIAHLNKIGGHILNMLLANALAPCETTRPIKELSSLNLSTKGKIQDGLASWWLTKDYLGAPKAPDVLVIGGSQLGALYGADAYVYNKTIDVATAHTSYTLEHNLEALLSKHLKVFIAPLPTSNISDQFLACRSLLSTKQKPQLVSITFSPKDFIDKTVYPQTETETSTFFSRYKTSLSHENSAWVNQKKRQKSLTDIASLQNFLATNKYPVSYAYGTRFSNSFNRLSPLTLTKQFEYICPGELTINSADGYFFSDDSKNYQKRYRNPFGSQLNQQMSSLEALLAYLQQEHIKVVVFSLPLTTSNRKLLPADFWQFYDKHIGELCKKTGADWINIDKDVKGFNDKEFMDSIHLNLIGGHRLASTLALYIANKFHWMSFAQLQDNERNML